VASFETASTVAGSRGASQDRVEVFHRPPCVIIAVADGAGGTGGGSLASSAVISMIGCAAGSVSGYQAWAGKLKEIDDSLHGDPGGGQSTAVVVEVSPKGIVGASVGDSQAWVVMSGGLADLTKGQQRKPLLGTGKAKPVPFYHERLDGTLLVATDGLFNYAKPERIAALAVDKDLQVLPKKFVDLVRLRSGELWDDVGLVLCRREE
jgi:PPM family protein phosphatase